MYPILDEYELDLICQGILVQVGKLEHMGLPASTQAARSFAACWLVECRPAEPETGHERVQNEWS